MKSSLPKMASIILASVATIVSWPSVTAAQTSGPAMWQYKIHPRVLADTAGGARASAVVLLADQADLSQAHGIADADARGWYVYRTLRAHAAHTQLPLRNWLRARGIHYRAFWAANMLVVDTDRDVVEQLAARADTHSIESNAPLQGVDDPPMFALPDMAAASTIEWGVNSVNAPAVWALGYTGQGIVIGVQDTGMQWNHPALQPHYRGWNGTAADHNYNWHDAIHNSVANPCGNDAPAPCDDDGHGTHTTGTTSGDDGHGNQIGVAPGARWIGCRNMDRGDGTPARYTECFQFFIAPTDQSGNNPDPTKRPHVMNNSWGCPPSEGCAANTLETIVSNAEAAGIFVVASAGNAGPGCGSVNDPPPIYASAFSVGAYDMTTTLASFSSRGPVTVNGSNLMKPEIAAPGVNVRSAYPTNTYTSLQGTSMASPHVVGVVALLWSAQPQLARDIATTKAILEDTANPNVIVSPAQVCGGVSTSALPNNSFGYGRVDALAAVSALPFNSPTATASATPTSSQPSATMTRTVTATPSPTRRATSTSTPTRTQSKTPTPTRTAIVAATRTSTPTRTRPPATPTSTVPNDACTSAAVVSSLPYTRTISVASASSAGTDPVPPCGNGSRRKSVWYKYTAPVTRTVTANTFGSNYDTILAAYTGSCGWPQPLVGACNDNASLTRQSQISFMVRAGTTYYFLVTSSDGLGTTSVFSVR